MKIVSRNKGVDLSKNRRRGSSSGERVVLGEIGIGARVTAVALIRYAFGFSNSGCYSRRGHKTHATAHPRVSKIARTRLNRASRRSLGVEIGWVFEIDQFAQLASRIG